MFSLAFGQFCPSSSESRGELSLTGYLCGSPFHRLTVSMPPGCAYDMAETCRTLLSSVDACECNRGIVRCQKEMYATGLFAPVWENVHRLHEQPIINGETSFSVNARRWNTYN
jgi:hypothetical protein